MEVKKRGRGLKNLLGAAGVAAGLLTQLPALAVNPPTNVRVRTGRSAEIKEDDGVNMSFTLDWDDTQTNITKYRVYKSTDGTTFVNQGQNPNGETAKNESQSVAIAKTNWFFVTAWTDTTESAASTVLPVYGSAPPSSPMFADSTNGVVQVGWYNMSHCTVSNHIERATDTNFSSIISFWPDKSATGYTDNWPFTPGQMYYYRVRSWSANGESLWKWVMNVAPNSVPNAPYLLSSYTTATSTNGTVPTSVGLAWYDLANNEDGYYIERKVGLGNWNVIDHIGVYDNFLGLYPSLSYVDGPLPTGQVIYYRVYATNYAGISDYATTQILLPSSPATPSTTTNWFVDNAVVGSSYSGDSWANAWGDLNSINWTVVKPGDYIWISGGTTGKVYTQPLVVGASGTSNNWITIHTATNSGHNGKVYFQKMTSFGDTPTWVTVSGAKSDTYVPNS